MLETSSGAIGERNIQLEESEESVVDELEPVCVAVVPEVPVEVDVGWVAVAPLPPQK
jgi:hypothetical protein